ncbi:hypothetical protein [Thiomicrorhabdus aquaedulcis]|uniref:hypothetical protein n=1 Tax=Thiomicrorhabdus aquaedulcis TaxID=2211106 RepID=UPI000FD9DC4C|nr:hypothetical protein [Thiomicrorhabdus aquaedulcis]
MLIKKTHRFLEVLLAIFVVYLLLTRAVITWAQSMPEPFVASVEWLTASEVNFSELTIKQDWLGFELQVHNLTVNRPEFSLKLDLVKGDINLFAPLWPSLDYGAALIIQNGHLETKSNLTTQDSLSQDNAVQADLVNPVFSLEQWQTRAYEHLNVGRLWKRIKFDNITLSDATRPGQSLKIVHLQALKAAQMHVVAEVSLGLPPGFNHERFNIKARVIPNVWGKVAEAQLSLAAFEPLNAHQVAQWLPPKWHSILPSGELMIDVNAHVKRSRLAEVTINLYGQSLQWPQSSKSVLPGSLGLVFNWQAPSTQSQYMVVSLSNIQINNRYVASLAPIEVMLDDEHIHFKTERFDIEPFKVMVAALANNNLVTQLFGKTAQLDLANLNGQLNWQTLSLPYLAFDVLHLDIPVTHYPGLIIRNLAVKKDAQSMHFTISEPILINEPSVHATALKVALPKKLP